ncbi:MAG: hypothetical protein PHC75_10275 [Burkholderiales bacterium]|nr:hypothetical protein [Burkholderiales bacterium]
MSSNTTDAIKASKAKYEQTRTSIRISKELASMLKEKATSEGLSIEKYLYKILGVEK